MRLKPGEPAQRDYLARLGMLLPPSGGGEDPPESERAAPLEHVRRFTTQHMKVLSALALGAVIFATWALMRGQTTVLDEPSLTPTWVESTPVPTPQWLIHVLGAVDRPGVVSVPAGARVADAIAAAGGFTQEADPGELNLAAVLVDGAQVVIGTRGTPQGEVRQGANPGGVAAGQGVEGAPSANTISLNQATQAELESLPGVGPVTAMAILAWRERSGPFTAIAQLQEVDGIGPKTYAQIEPHVSL